MTIAITLHILAAVIWVGGMFFAYTALRPVAATLFEPPVRLTMWCHVFSRFFPWVWISVVALLVTGLGIIKIFGGMGAVGMHVHIMLLLGIIMMLIFMHLFFSPYKKLKRAVTSEDWQAAGEKDGNRAGHTRAKPHPQKKLPRRNARLLRAIVS